jgi:hypothetical protein
MHPDEYQDYLNTGMVQPSKYSNKVDVAYPATAEAYIKEAAYGSYYVEFDVPLSSIKQTYTDRGWAVVRGPTDIFARQDMMKGLTPPELPPARNIVLAAIKLMRKN